MLIPLFSTFMRSIRSSTKIQNLRFRSQISSIFSGLKGLKLALIFFRLNHLPTNIDEISALVEFTLESRLKFLSFQQLKKRIILIINPLWRLLRLILPRTNAPLTEKLLKTNTKNEMNHSFHHYLTISEYSEKQTTAIFEKELNFLHEIKLLQKLFLTRFENPSPDDIYNTIKKVSKGNRLDFKWFIYYHHMNFELEP